MPKAERWPVEVGQVRKDPDPRMQIRGVRVLAVDETHATVERAGRKARIRLDRLERWRVLPPAEVQP